MPAPVALFTYNRPHHTRATLEALARNTTASKTDLFVYSDGPKDAQESYSVASVRALVRSQIAFASVNVIERPRNLGLAQSVITGVSELLKTFDSVIVLEDDIVTSRHFLDFMNDALDHYKLDRSAFSVTGHTFPTPYMHVPADYPFDTYSGFRCSSWSWGTWRNRWRLIDWEMTYFDRFMTNRRAQRAFDRGGCDMTAMLKLQREGKIDSWAIRFCYAHYVNGMRCIYPVKTLVRNVGLDRSGTHSVPEPRFSHAALDDSWRPRHLCPAKLIDSRIAANFRSVFDAGHSQKSKSKWSTIFSKGDEVLRSAHYAGIRFLRQLLTMDAGISRGEDAGLQPRDSLSEQNGTGRDTPSSTEGPSQARSTEILVVNSFQKEGGAARAAYRSVLGLKRVFSDVHYLTLFKDDEADDISGVQNRTYRAAKARELALIDQEILRQYPDRDTNAALFTPNVLANPFRVPLSQFNAKLIHLHWVAQTVLDVEELAKLNVPVVWTLHDTWAFTGGCHYTQDCDRFTDSCGLCPQLGSRVENDLSRMLWLRKRDAFADLNLTIVAPSRWLGRIAAASSLLGGRRLEVIPNGLDTEVFRPLDKNAARTQLGIPSGAPVILFGAQWLKEYRKGGDLLREAIAQIDYPCHLCTFGAESPDLLPSEFVSVKAFGSVEDDSSLALIYSAAEVFVCPSRQDNLPNTVAEALACGTPCVAFDVGGLPEMIEHKKTGWLAEAFDSAEFATGIKWIVEHPEPESLRTAARKKALASYDLDVTTRRYARLFDDLLGDGQLSIARI